MKEIVGLVHRALQFAILSSVVGLCAPAQAATSLRPPAHVVELPGAGPISTGQTDVTAIVGRFASGPLNAPTRVTSATQFTRLFGNSGADNSSVQLFFANGGVSAYVVRVADAQPGAIAQGLNSLANSNFRLLIVPVTYDMAPNDAAQAINTAIQVAGTKSAFYFIDVPRSFTTLNEVRDYRQQFESREAAIFFPGVMTTTGPAPSSGAVAGRHANSDRKIGFWKPATEPLAGIQGLTPSLTSPELAAYTPDSKGFNLLRDERGRGVLPVAHRTLSTDPEWRHINVARKQRIIESSVRDGLAWATVEPNNEATWTKVRATVEAYMADLYRKGALQGAKPQDAYAVKCDRTVMTESDLAKGRLAVLVLFAPTRPAEFYAARIVLTMK